MRWKIFAKLLQQHFIEKILDETKDPSGDIWVSLYVNIKMQLVLSKDDKEALSYGRMLNDKLINFAQMLLKTQFPVIEGLVSTLLQYTDLQKN